MPYYIHMRIALVANVAYPVPPLKYGGTERLIYFIAKGLHEEGHDVTVFASADSHVPCKLVALVPEHIPFVEDEAESRRVLKLHEAARAKAITLLNDSRDQFDIVHTFADPFSELELPVLVTEDRVPVLREMGHLARDFHSRPFVTVSANLAEVYPRESWLGVVYNGLDPEDFPIVKQPLSEYFCFLGRMDRDKNPHTAIELAIALGMPIKIGAKVDANGKYYFEEVCKTLLDNPLVEFLGEVDQVQKAELVGNAVLNLHPVNFREPFGYTIIEAGFCGTPTMANSRGSMPELITDGQTGFLEEDFLAGFYRASDWRSLDRTKVAEYFRAKFTYKMMAQEYLRKYELALEYYQKNHL